MLCTPTASTFVRLSGFITIEKSITNTNSIMFKTWQCESGENRGERTAQRHRPEPADPPQHPFHSSYMYNYKYLSHWLQ